MSFVFPPKGWALCNGQLLPINQNQALFALLGTTYGGDGRVTFALPDLRGRVAAHVGDGHTLGEVGAAILASYSTIAAAWASSPRTLAWMRTTAEREASTGSAAYSPPGSPVAMAANALGSAGSSQPHENRQPFLTLSFCIALQGIFPSQS